MAIWKGRKFITHADGFEFTPGAPARTTRRMEGSREQMLPRALALYTAGWRAAVTRDEGSPIWRVEAVVEGNPNDPESNIVDTHELHGNVLNPSNLTAPYLLSQFTGQPYAAIAAVQAIANDIQSGKKTYEAGVQAIADSSDVEDADQTLCGNLLAEIVQGVSHYIQFQPVYRHTYNYGWLTTLRAGIQNIGSLFTPQQLIADEDIPNGDSNDIADLGGVWLKVFPQKLNQLGQRRQVTREYWWAKTASALYYPPAI